MALFWVLSAHTPAFSRRGKREGEFGGRRKGGGKGGKKPWRKEGGKAERERVEGGLEEGWEGHTRTQFCLQPHKENSTEKRKRRGWREGRTTDIIIETRNGGSYSSDAWYVSLMF